jgi:hypothetical protein
MRSRALLFLCALLLSTSAEAQVMWQPTEPPLVTAENESWFRSGGAIEWNGEFYFPAGAPEAFNRYQMVRAGSYRGIPLYTDTTLEPYSIVLVPIAGGRMQPYERPRAGMLAGSAGSRSSSFPTAIEPGSALAVTNEGYVAQAPAPPTFARAYDLGPAPTTQPVSPAVPIVGSLGVRQTPASAAGTSGRVTAPVAPQPAGTSGRVTTVTNGASTAARPQGINGAWVEYAGRRWVSAGKGVDLTADFAQIGEYRGSPIYQRRGDTSTIYVPMTPGLLVPFKSR